MPLEPATGAAAPTLARRLGLPMAVAVVVGNVIGAGIFFMPSEVAGKVPFPLLSLGIWIACGLFALCGALALAEVAVLYPQAGGNYVFLREAFGRLYGFLWGWVAFWIIGGAGVAALAVKFTDHLAALLEEGGIPVVPDTHVALTLGLLAGLALINGIGVRSGGAVQLASTLIKIVLLMVIAALPFYDLLRSGGPRATALGHLRPPLPDSWHSLGLAALTAAFVAVVWVYDGWMHVTSVAEEVRRPERNLPWALVGGMGLVMVLYLTANLAYDLVIPPADMASLANAAAKPPVAGELAQRVLGRASGAIVTAVVLISIFGILNGCFLVYPRVLYAMGRDGLAPEMTAVVHPSRQTPAMAILILMMWAILLVVSGALYQRLSSADPNQSLFGPLMNLSMFGTLSLQSLAVSSVFVFRRRHPPVPGRYRCWGYPVTPILYVGSMLAVLIAQCFTMPGIMLAGGGMMIAGTAYYALRARRRPHGAGPAAAPGGPDEQSRSGYWTCD